jgi:Cu/Ag efflux protein CusF
MKVALVSGVASVALLLLPACDRSSQDAAAVAAATAAAPTEYMAVGTFNSANPAAGTVNISHAPVPAAGWPAMTMDFKLPQPGTVAGLEPGTRVDIHFTVEDGMNATITHIEPIE